MISLDAESHVHWMAPSPLWSEARRQADQDGLHRPALLRFASDSFMDDFLALLAADPSRLGALRAVPETWRGPVPSLPPVERPPAFQLGVQRRKLALQAGGNGLALAKPPTQATASAPRMRLKLFQPAHQRFYLVAACLVCRIPGFPDRVLDPGRPDKATYVLRRLRNPADPQTPSVQHDPSACVEYAYITGGSQPGWQRVNQQPGQGADTLVPGEEQLPLSGVSFNEDDGRTRRLLVGLVPVGRREAYIGAPEVSATNTVMVAPQEPGAPDPPDPLLYPLQLQVTGPWKNLFEQVAKTQAILNDPDNPPPANKRPGIIAAARQRLQTSSWYVLLDLANYLSQQVPAVWQALSGQSPSLQPAEQALLSALQGATLDAGLASDLLVGDRGASRVASSLADALVAAKAAESQLEGVVLPYQPGPRPTEGVSWPTVLFPLVDPLGAGPLATANDVTHLEQLVRATNPSGPTPATPGVLQPALDPRGNDWFVIRCVFQRPNCDPLTPALLSVASQPFELAGFFDPDAPARPIRIGLPVDISPAGLRKADKNTVFVLSDLLCGQVNRMKGLTLGDLVRSVLPFPFHQDLPVDSSPGPCPGPGSPVSFGMICSLSIPIITICALILLIIIVSLLDIVFHWLPYFMLCFPFPRFRAKESG